MLAEGPGTQASEGSPEGSPSPIPAIAATHLAGRGHQGLWRGFVGRSGSPSKHGPNPCPCPGPALQVRIRGRPLAPSTLISGLTAVSLGAVSLPRLLMPVADLQLGVLLCGAEGRTSGGWHGGDLEGPQNSFLPLLAHPPALSPYCRAELPLLSQLTGHRPAVTLLTATHPLLPQPTLP